MANYAGNVPALYASAIISIGIAVMRLRWFFRIQKELSRNCQLFLV